MVSEPSLPKASDDGSSSSSIPAIDAEIYLSNLNVVVIVLGDLGRSPRMQHHVQSLLDAGHSVTLVGYNGVELIPTLTHRRFRDRLRVVRFTAPVLPRLKQLSLALYFVWRILSLSLLLMYNLLFRVHAPAKTDLILIQNPPALPLLAVAVFYSYYIRAPLVVDWHNLGYSMLPSSCVFLRTLGAWYERMWSPLAHGHLTVTHALREFLTQEGFLVSSSFLSSSSSTKNAAVADTDHSINTINNTNTNQVDINLDVLMDCPTALFRSCTVREQHELLRTVDATLCAACPSHWSAFQDPKRQTLFTEQLEGVHRYAWRAHRPALITSATSYTRDEDIGLLLNALELIDARIEAQEQHELKILCVITGKGPLKKNYIEQASQLKLQHVAVTTLWLSPADYPRWLACADLGVSLHTSTSGRDLPIKILDYFGCEVPVVAYNFSCLYELVQDDVNGRVFTTSQELSDCLYDLLLPLAKRSVDEGGDSPPLSNHDFGDLKRYSLQIQGKLLWSQNWTRHAWPVIATAIKNFRKAQKYDRIYAVKNE